MYLTQKNQIRNLNKSEFLALRELCRLSKNLYNVGLYTVRQYYFQERKHLRYESAYHLCKENENYRLAKHGYCSTDFESSRQNVSQFLCLD